MLRFLVVQARTVCKQSTRWLQPQVFAASLSRVRAEPVRPTFTFGVALAAVGATIASTSTRDNPAVIMETDDLSHKLYADEQRTVALFERCSGSVVHINTMIEKQVLVPGREGYRLDLQDIPQGQGSGFIWDSQHVVTNYHVIKDAEKAVIVLADNTHCEAMLVGIDPDCDLAVLKIGSSSSSQSTPLRPLERGRSNNLNVGQRVYAIGNPFGLDQTLTSGIVSGLGREVKGVNGNPIRGVIQTDAAINPGNSGGPLLDARGRLIGVNTMIASPSGAFAGVGFAIPVDTVVRVVQQLVQYGRIRRAYLGVYCAPDHVTQRISRERYGDSLNGVLILSIEPGSPADKAGLQPTYRTRTGIVLGDEIIEVNGRTISSPACLTDAVNACSIGDEIQLTCRRRGQERDSVHTFETAVKLRERPRREQPVVHQGGGQLIGKW